MGDDEEQDANFDCASGYIRLRTTKKTLPFFRNGSTLDSKSRFPDSNTILEIGICSFVHIINSGQFQVTSLIFSFWNFVGTSQVRSQSRHDGQAGEVLGASEFEPVTSLKSANS